MPVQTDTPIGVGRNDWGLWGSAPSVVAAVAANDGDASVVFADSGGRQNLILYTFPLLAGMDDPVNSATLLSVARAFISGSQTRYYFHWWNGAQLANNWGTYPIAASFPSYCVLSDSAPSLDLASVNGQHGFLMAGSGGPGNKWECWTTYFHRQVNYTYKVGAAGEFVHLIASLVGALIGSSLLLGEMPGLSRAMAKRGVRLRPDEYESAWREWRKRRFYALVG